MPDERPSQHPPASEDDAHAHGARRLVTSLLRKGFTSGMDAISRSEDTVRSLVEGMKLPKEVVGLLFEQIDETKTGVYRAVAKEIRDFLNSTNFATEMKKVLTGLAFEVKMEVRFKEAGSGGRDSSVRPDVTAEVTVRDRERRRKRDESSE